MEALMNSKETSATRARILFVLNYSKYLSSSAWWKVTLGSINFADKLRCKYLYLGMICLDKKKNQEGEPGCKEEKKISRCSTRYFNVGRKNLNIAAYNCASFLRATFLQICLSLFFPLSFSHTRAEGHVITSPFRRRYFGKRITKSRRDRNRILKYGAYFIADTDTKKKEKEKNGRRRERSESRPPRCPSCCHEIFAAAGSACTADKTKSD